LLCCCMVAVGFAAVAAKPTATMQQHNKISYKIVGIAMHMW